MEMSKEMAQIFMEGQPYLEINDLYRFYNNIDENLKAYTGYITTYFLTELNIDPLKYMIHEKEVPELYLYAQPIPKTYLKGTGNNAALYLPGIKAIGRSAFFYATGGGIIDLRGIDAVGEDAFEDSEFHTIIFEDKLPTNLDGSRTNIITRAFLGMRKLHTVKVPKRSNAFSDLLPYFGESDIISGDQYFRKPYFNGARVETY